MCYIIFLLFHSQDEMNEVSNREDTNILIQVLEDILIQIDTDDKNTNDDKTPKLYHSNNNLLRFIQPTSSLSTSNIMVNIHIYIYYIYNIIDWYI
jgi:hypothetical protein